MGFLEELQEIEFIGGEFATWLLVETARDRGPADWNECQACVIEVPGPITFEGPGHGAIQVILKGDTLLDSPELRSAIAEGKHVRKMKLSVDLDGDHWQGTLDTKTLEWRSVKLSVPPVPDVEEFAFMRTQAFERLTLFLDEWVSAFLRVRMDDNAWDEEIERIREFAASKPAE